MNGKFILALFAALAAVTLAKPATRLDLAVQEAAEAFRVAAVDGIEKAAGGLQGELGAATNLATGIVNGGGAGGAASSAGSGGIFSTIMNFLCAPLRMMGLMSALPSAGALPGGAGGAAGLLNKLPGGAGGAGALLNALPAGAAVNVAEDALKTVTGRRKRAATDAVPAAAGDATKNTTGSGNSTHALTGAAGNGTALNGTAAGTPAACVLGWGEWIFSLFGLLSNRCNTPAATTAAANATSMATNGNSTADHGNSSANSNSTGTKTPAATNTQRRKRAATDAVPAAAGDATKNTTGSDNSTHALTGAAGNGTALNGTVAGTPAACVLGWGEWIFSLFGLLSNRCNTPTAVPATGANNATSMATPTGNSTAAHTNGTDTKPPAATGTAPAVQPTGRK